MDSTFGQSTVGQGDDAVLVDDLSHLVSVSKVLIGDNDLWVMVWDTGRVDVSCDAYTMLSNSINGTKLIYLRENRDEGCEDILQGTSDRGDPL